MKAFDKYFSFCRFYLCTCFLSKVKSGQVVYTAGAYSSFYSHMLLAQEHNTMTPARAEVQRPRYESSALTTRPRRILSVWF